MSVNEIIFSTVFLILGLLLGYCIGYTRKSILQEKKENIEKDKILFNQIEYPEDYFTCYKIREEARIKVMDISLQKINQPIGYLISSIVSIFTILNLNITNNFIKMILLLNSIIFFIYVFIRIIYWSVYYDFSMTVAPKKPKEPVPFTSQDNLLSRYKWAIDYRMDHPENNIKRLILKWINKIPFICKLFIMIVFNVIYVILVFLKLIPCTLGI